MERLTVALLQMQERASRVWRSTSVPIADCCSLPMIKSPPKELGRIGPRAGRAARGSTASAVRSGAGADRCAAGRGDALVRWAAGNGAAAPIVAGPPALIRARRRPGTCSRDTTTSPGPEKRRRTWSPRRSARSSPNQTRPTAVAVDRDRGDVATAVPRRRVDAHRRHRGPLPLHRVTAHAERRVGRAGGSKHVAEFSPRGIEGGPVSVASLGVAGRCRQRVEGVRRTAERGPSRCETRAMT